MRLTPDPTVIAWRKSSYSDGGDGNCIEVGDDLPDTIPVRDSKNPAGPILLFPAAAWSAFIDTVKSGGHKVGRITRC